MRSVFGKLIIWFLLTVLVSGMGFVLSTAVNLASSESRQPPFGMLLTLQMNEARNAYERGGTVLLTETLDRFRAVMRGECFLADADGRDLSTGDDLRPLIQRITGRPRLEVLWSEEIGFARRTSDNMYWYVVFVHRRNWLRWFFSLEHLWIFGTVLLLCYTFAFHLTSPLRGLQRAVDRFGRGDLSARASTNRRDELGDLSRSFNTMADRIQTLLTAERRLLLDISHELRSPLARLSLAVELARSGEDREAALNRIQKEADRVNLMLTELLQVTRAEGDPSQRKLETVALDDVAHGVVEDGRVETQARECEVTLVSAEAVKVQGDYELIRRALENVVRNAIRFAPRGSAVEVRVRGEADAGILEVRDYGPGVPEEALSRIFDPFYRVETDRNRSSGGVGLGLSIAKRAIQVHGGTLCAWNEHPGLRVEIRVPCVPRIPATEIKDPPSID